MADLKKDLTALRDPAKIKKAGLASSPYVLRKIIAADPMVRRLIASGEKVVPLIAEEVGKAGKLDEISLSALVFIVESVKADAAPKIFGALFRKEAEKPGAFFVHFAAHAIRSGLRLPVKPSEAFYSRAEIFETLNTLKTTEE